MLGFLLGFEPNFWDLFGDNYNPLAFFVTGHHHGHKNKSKLKPKLMASNQKVKPLFLTTLFKNRKTSKFMAIKKANIRPTW
jgi:hypothetical protein